MDFLDCTMFTRTHNRRLFLLPFYVYCKYNVLSAILVIISFLRQTASGVVHYSTNDQQNGSWWSLKWRKSMTTLSSKILPTLYMSSACKYSKLIADNRQLDIKRPNNIYNRVPTGFKKSVLFNISPCVLCAKFAC